MRRMLVLAALLAGCGGSEADPFGGEGTGGRAGGGASGGAVTGGTGGQGGGAVSCAPRAADAVYAWTYTWTGGQHDDCRTTAPTTRPGGPNGVPSAYGCTAPADLASCSMDVSVTCSPAQGQSFTFTGAITWSADGRTCSGTLHMVASLPQGQGCDAFFDVTCARQ